VRLSKYAYQGVVVAVIRIVYCLEKLLDERVGKSISYR